MSTFYQILALFCAGLLVWFTYAVIKGQPNQFSQEKLAKSFSTMGLLALVLIGFVGLLVLFIRAH